MRDAFYSIQFKILQYGHGKGLYYYDMKLDNVAINLKTMIMSLLGKNKTIFFKFAIVKSSYKVQY